MKTPKLTAAGRRVLENLEAGRPIYEGLHGRSAHGGLSATVGSLFRRGLVTKFGAEITPAGRAALKDGVS